MLPLFAIGMIGGAAKAINTPKGEDIPKTSPKVQRKSAKRQDSQISLIKGEAGDLGLLSTFMKTLNPEDYLQARTYGVLTLQKFQLNGEGSTVIVYDTDFEKDAMTNFVKFENPNYIRTNEDKGILHGNRVASALASKNPEASGIAEGATVYPIKSMSNRAPINQSFINNLESALEDCKKWNLPKPRVINMSQSFYVHKDSTDLIGKLATILKQNDMLLVVSAGNEGMKGDAERIGTRPWVSVRGMLHELPELAEHVLLVGSFDSDTKKTLSDYSNPAGEQKSHYITTEGFQLGTSVFDETTGVRKTDKDQLAVGTSFASPQVAGMASILGKYFPDFSMKDVKSILLKSALKLKDQDDALVGQGALNPLQAWIMALEASKPTDVESEEEAEIRALKEALENLEREQTEEKERALARQQAELKIMQDNQEEMAKLQAQIEALRAQQAQPAVQEKTGFFKKLFGRFRK